MAVRVDHLKSMLGDQLSCEKADLAAHAGDLWPRRILSERLGQKSRQPIAVVTPRSIEAIQKLLKWANEERVAIIPFGGGSGVCGATQPVKDSVVLDMKYLNSVKMIDLKSQTVTAAAGILGPDLEKQLNERNLTLNHFPASFHISTLGGWIATRAAGQLSTAYGSIEDNLLAVKVVLPNGEILETKLTPRAATGPSLKELFLGAEGTLGVVVEATCQAYALPAQRDFLAFSFADIPKALEAVRTLIQREVRPAVVRLYDEADTQLVLSEMRIEAGGNLLILAFQGEKEMVAFQKKIAWQHLSKLAKDLGEKPGEHWWRHRFDLNDQKMLSILSQKGMILDTIEVAACWSNLEKLYQNMKRVIEAEITVLAHFSHFYPSGGSIYFTFIGAVEEKESLTKYDRVWDRAMESCLEAGGTISHHHGIGLLKKKWLKRELNGGYSLLTQIKQTLDPKNILNPDKLL